MIPLSKVRKALREVHYRVEIIQTAVYAQWGTPLEPGRATWQLERLEDDLWGLIAALTEALAAIRTALPAAEADDAAVWGERRLVECRAVDRLAGERKAA